MTDQRRHVVVIGGGISGLAAAHRLATHAAPGQLRITVLDAAPRLGGWVRTEPFAGRPVDFGPDSLLVRTPWATQLADELGIADDLVAPGEGGAFLLTGGTLRRLPPGILAGLPGGPMPFIRSGLLSPRGLLRAALDLVWPANPPVDDESIGDLIRRRLGGPTLDRVIDPLLGGVHAGRCDDLSLEATAPHIAAASRAHRSLLRGLRATAPPPPDPNAPPRPIFMAPRAGMQTFTGALVTALTTAGVDLHTNASVTQLEPTHGPHDTAATPRNTTASPLPASPLPEGPPPEPEPEPEPEAAAVRVHLADGTTIDADGVVLAVPAHAAATLLDAHAPEASGTLRRLRYASVTHTALAYDPADVPDLPAGTGFLVPRREQRLMTACTFLDRKWPQRRSVGVEQDLEQGSLAGTVVLKCSAGRIDDARINELSDAELVDALHDELRDILGVRGEPKASRVVRVADGLPQYAPGHLARIAAVSAEVAAALPGVSLVGAAYRGASVPLCIRDGGAGADAQLTRLALRPPSPDAAPTP